MAESSQPLLPASAWQAITQTTHPKTDSGRSATAATSPKPPWPYAPQPARRWRPPNSCRH